MFDSATVVSVVNLVKPASRTAGPTLIGIDGLTAAGKSTLARQIAQACQDAPIIHLDDFYREFSTEAMASFSAREGYHRYFDWERLLHHVLDKLRRGETASYDRFDWSHGSPAARTMVEPHGVILVEGVYAVRPELQHAFDATVFVGTPRSVRTSRIEGRKNEDTVWVSQWRAAEEWCVRYFSPKKRCDLVIAGG